MLSFKEHICGTKQLHWNQNVGLLENGLKKVIETNGPVETEKFCCLHSMYTRVSISCAFFRLNMGTRTRTGKH